MKRTDRTLFIGMSVDVVFENEGGTEALLVGGAVTSARNAPDGIGGVAVVRLGQPVKGAGGSLGAVDLPEGGIYEPREEGKSIDEWSGSVEGIGRFAVFAK